MTFTDPNNDIGFLYTGDKSPLWRKSNWLTGFLVFWLLVLSANPITRPIPGGNEVVLSVSLLAIFFVVVRRGIPHRLVQLTVLLIGFYAAFFLIQGVHLGDFYFITNMGFFTKLLCGLLIVGAVAYFPLWYIEVLTLLCLISLPFFILSLTGLLDPLIPQINLFNSPLQQGTRFPLGLYTYKLHKGIIQRRNFGMFVEPGWLAGYCNMALVFLVYYKDRLPKLVYQRRFIILNLTLLTTLSTGGYAGLPLVWLLHSWKAGRNRLFKLILIGILLSPLGYVGWTQAYFLGPKITHFVQRGFKVEDPRMYRNRLWGPIGDWQAYIKDHPLVGGGLYGKTETTQTQGWTLPRSPLGVTDVFVKLGLIGGGIIYILLFRQLWFCSGRQLVPWGLGCGVFLTAIMTENFLFTPFILGLFALRVSEQQIRREKQPSLPPSKNQYKFQQNEIT